MAKGCDMESKWTGIEAAAWSALVLICSCVLLVIGAAAAHKVYEGNNQGLNYRQTLMQTIRVMDISYEYDVDVTVIFQDGKIIRVETSEVLLAEHRAKGEEHVRN
jgi:hypothetical protein